MNGNSNNMMNDFNNMNNNSNNLMNDFNNMNNNSNNLMNDFNNMNNNSNNLMNDFNNMNNNSNNINNDLDKKKNPKFLLFIILFAIVIIGGFVCYKKFFSGSGSSRTNNKDSEDVNYTTSFFIKDANFMRALFNDKGEKLTDFEFSEVSNFKNGYAIVQKDNQYGIISETGKMTVEFGKYTTIMYESGLFKAYGRDNNVTSTYLIDGSGKVLYDLGKYEIIKTTVQGTWIAVQNKDNNEVIVMSSKGDKLVSFTKKGDISFGESSRVLAVNHDNTTWIFDLYSGKKLASFNSNNKKYSISAVDTNREIVLLRDGNNQVLIKNGKVLDNLSCTDIKIYDNVVTCKKTDGGIYVLDGDNPSYDISRAAFSTNWSYVKNSDGANSGVDFYNKNKKAGHVDCRNLNSTGYIENEAYILSTYDSDSCGTKAGSSELYNANGKKLSAAYDSISKASYGYYVVTKDNKKGVIDSNGKQILPCEYTSADISKSQSNIYAVLSKGDSTKIIYNLEKNKQLLSTSGTVSFENNFISVVDAIDRKTQCYTYDGKMFYERSY